ncbi:MAG: zinc ribbon domain-containing protein [Coriobacteriia bacterium]|nr:zinc ribbon domain-containing protein [Coriobacteriia bacterium]
MSRVSAKRMLVLAAAAVALALLVALGLAALRGGDSAVSRLLGLRTLELGVPLAAGAVIGLGAWALLDDPVPAPQDASYAEMACPVCGRAILEDWRLCPYCGSFVATADPRAPRPANGRS